MDRYGYAEEVYHSSLPVEQLTPPFPSLQIQVLLKLQYPSLDEQLQRPREGRNRTMKKEKERD